MRLVPEVEQVKRDTLCCYRLATSGVASPLLASGIRLVSVSVDEWTVAESGAKKVEIRTGEALSHSDPHSVAEKLILCYRESAPDTALVRLYHRPREVTRSGYVHRFDCSALEGLESAASITEL